VLTSNSGHSRLKSRVSYAKKVLVSASYDPRKSRRMKCQSAFLVERVGLGRFNSQVEWLLTEWISKVLDGMKGTGDKMKRRFLQLFITGMAVLICLASPNSRAFQEDATLANRVAWESSSQSGQSETGNFILYESKGGVACRLATTEEALLLSRRDRSDQLTRISPVEEYSLASQQNGLQIILRATPQL